MPTVRSSRIVYCNNASSVVITLPTGATAGDLTFIFAGHGFAVSTPSGWTPLNPLSGSNANGSTFQKVLTSGDITTGSVTIGFSGTYYGVVAMVCMTGSGTWDIFHTAARNSSGASTRNLSTPNSIKSGSVALWFSYGRGNITVTCNRGTLIQTSSNLNASGALYNEAVGSSGVDTATFSYSSTPTGDYEAVIVIQDIPLGFQVSKADLQAWLQPPAGLNISKAELLAWLESNDFRCSKMELLAWLDPVTAPADYGFCSVIWE